MSATTPPIRAVHVENLQPGDVVTCGPGEIVEVVEGSCHVASLMPGEAFQVGPEPRGVVLPEVTRPGYQQIDLRLGSAAEQRIRGELRRCDYGINDRYLTADVLAVARGAIATIREQAAVLADALEEAGMSGPDVKHLRDGSSEPMALAAVFQRIWSDRESR